MSSAYANSANTSCGFFRLPLFLQSQCSWWTNGTTKRIAKAYNKKKWSQGLSLIDASIDNVAFGCHYKCWGVLLHNSENVPNLRLNSICVKNFEHLFFAPQNQTPFKSMNMIKGTFLWLRTSTAIIRRPRTCEEVDRDGRKPFCVGQRSLCMTGLIIFRIIRL